MFSFGLNFILAFRFLSFDKYRINQNQNQNLVIAVELHFALYFFKNRGKIKFACCRLRADLVETDVNLNLETYHPIKEHFHVQSNALPVSYIPYIKAATFTKTLKKRMYVFVRLTAACLYEFDRMPWTLTWACRTSLMSTHSSCVRWSPGPKLRHV